MKKSIKKAPKVEDPTKSREVVRRNELTVIMKQIIDNVNEMAKHLMNDVNTLFKRFVYPTMMRTNAIENVLIKNGVLTKEQINEETKFLTEEAIKKAKTIEEEQAKKGESGAPNEGIKAEESAKIQKSDEPKVSNISKFKPVEEPKLEETPKEKKPYVKPEIVEISKEDYEAKLKEATKSK